MSYRIKVYGLGTTQHSSFTGLDREIVAETGKKIFVYHDGETQAGIPMAREDLVHCPIASASQNGVMSASRIQQLDAATIANGTNLTAINSEITNRINADAALDSRVTALEDEATNFTQIRNVQTAIDNTRVAFAIGGLTTIKTLNFTKQFDGALGFQFTVSYFLTGGSDDHLDEVRLALDASEVIRIPLLKPTGVFDLSLGYFTHYVVFPSVSAGARSIDIKARPHTGTLQIVMNPNSTDDANLTLQTSSYFKLEEYG